MIRTLILIGALFATSAMAAAPQEGARPTRQKRTVIHFGEDDIRGGITRPDGELVQAPRKPREESLLRVRKSFSDRALAAPLAGR
jgi:hypothetical protein